MLPTHVLAERIVGARMVEEAGAIEETIGKAGAAVLAQARWMRAADGCNTLGRRPVTALRRLWRGRWIPSD